MINIHEAFRAVQNVVYHASRKRYSDFEGIPSVAIDPRLQKTRDRGRHVHKPCVEFLSPKNSCHIVVLIHVPDLLH